MMPGFQPSQSMLRLVLQVPRIRSGFWYLSFRLTPALWPRVATFDSPGFRALKVLSWNPILIVCLCSGGGHSRAVRTRDRNAFVGGTFLGSAALYALATASGTLLGEVGRNPDGVEEIDDAADAGEDEEVEENDLGVEDARVRLDDADGLIESGDRVESTTGIAQDCG